MRVNPEERNGKRFGHCTLVEYINVSKCRILCDCGTEKIVQYHNLKRGSTVSCGCYGPKRSTTHGHTKGGKWSREYHTWVSMIDRCSRKSGINYKYYTKRGIKVCERWAKSFENFLADVGPHPGGNMTIDRIDNAKGYFPGNVKWSTHKEQCRNRTNSVIIECFGQKRNCFEWSEVTGLSANLIRSRIRSQGWSPERALTTPKLGKV